MVRNACSRCESGFPRPTGGHARRYRHRSPMGLLGCWSVGDRHRPPPRRPGPRIRDTRIQVSTSKRRRGLDHQRPPQCWRGSSNPDHDDSGADQPRGHRIPQPPAQNPLPSGNALGAACCWWVHEQLLRRSAGWRPETASRHPAGTRMNGVEVAGSAGRLAGLEEGADQQRADPDRQRAQRRHQHLLAAPRDVVGDLAGHPTRGQDRAPDEEAGAGGQRARSEQVQPLGGQAVGRLKQRPVRRVVHRWHGRFLPFGLLDCLPQRRRAARRPPGSGQEVGSHAHMAHNHSDEARTAGGVTAHPAAGHLPVH